ncbi:MAG TPA: PadR family transcriptional regulator [Firmicutes bacterium]|nr:PadR family transcriptional regulator [Bacillota bacterium]
MCPRRRKVQQRSALPCPGGKIERFIEPCLLLLLVEKPGHGYELLENLSQFDFDPRCMDPGQIYRTLRRMEKEGLVTSTWETGAYGPARRRYAVTDEGLEFLDLWISVLQKRVQVITKLLQRHAENRERQK